MPDLRTTLNTAKLNSDVYRRAAKLIERGRQSYACKAIGLAQWRAQRIPAWENNPYIKAFEDAFRPDDAPPLATFGWYGLPCTSAQNARIIALCFMAAMVERP